MAVFNKELVINGEAVRSPEQQVWKNTKDIKALKDKVREAYRYNGVLPIDSVTCPRGSVDSNFGYLIDNNSSVFKFQDGDNNTLLIQYLCNIKGPEGPAGSQYVVEANPDGEATDVLNKILIRDTFYTVGGGSAKKYRHYLTLNGTANSYAGQIWSFIIECDSNLPFAKNTDYVEGTNQNIQKWLREHFYCYSSTADTPGYASDNRFALPAMLIRTTNSVYACQGIMVKYDIGVGETDYFYYLPLDGNVALQQITNTTLKDQHIEEI